MCILRCGWYPGEELLVSVSCGHKGTTETAKNQIHLSRTLSQGIHFWEILTWKSSEISSSLYLLLKTPRTYYHKVSGWNTMYCPLQMWDTVPHGWCQGVSINILPYRGKPISLSFSMAFWKPPCPLVHDPFFHLPCQQFSTSSTVTSPLDYSQEHFSVFYETTQIHWPTINNPE